MREFKPGVKSQRRPEFWTLAKEDASSKKERATKQVYSYLLGRRKTNLYEGILDGG